MIFGSLQATMDYGMRFASFQYWWGGTYSPREFADFNTIKYLLFAHWSAFIICWTGIPFEVARKAYFADQTWPTELRKGYRSPLHALMKIPFVEGPLYLFKGGLLIYAGNSMFTSWCFFFYTWIKNKLFFLWVYNDIPYSWVKLFAMSFGFTAGSIVGYPFYRLKEIIDTWPKERGGHDTFEGSYYNALKWYRQNFDSYHTVLMQGYWKWFTRKGIIFFLAMWQADNLGLFTNYQANYNSFETIYGLEESD
jgi:solute carrier family 25 oxoglutarate transporter 11